MTKVNNSKSRDSKKILNKKSEKSKTPKQINLAIFGNGTVGGTLIDQINSSKMEILTRKKIKLTVFAIANSKSIL